MGEITQIPLDITDEMIKLTIENNDLLHLRDQDIEYIKEELKSKIYLNQVKNEGIDLQNQILLLEKEREEQFPKMFWEEYVYKYYINRTYQEYSEHERWFSNLRHFLNCHEELHGVTGEYIQNNPGCIPKEFDIFSWRSWGAVMAAYMNSKEKERKYTYMSFYM